MTKSLRSPSPQRVAVLGAMALLLATDQATAKPHSCRVTNFDADKDFTGKSDVTDGACALAAAYTMTALQIQVDIAGAAPAARHAKKGYKFETTGLGVKKATCIGIDGYGMASAPAAKTATCIGSGEALGATDEAGVIEFGASCEGMVPMALVAAAAKKASGSARRRAGSPNVVDRGSLGGELIEVLATGLELGPAWFSLWSGAADSQSATPPSNFHIKTYPAYLSFIP